MAKAASRLCYQVRSFANRTRVTTMQERFSHDARAYSGVRSLERGIQLLVELARSGGLKPAELTEATGVDRTTVYRLLETLRRCGFVSQNKSDGKFHLTLNVRRLGEGFTEADSISALVRPTLNKLVKEIRWPSDFASFDDGSMLVRETTHHLSPYSRHRSMVGAHVSLTRTALGRAVLWAANPDELRDILNLAASSGRPDAPDATDISQLSAVVADANRRGYAWSIDGQEPGISGIALPIKSRGHVVGAVNVIFFTRALRPAEAAQRYLPALKKAVDEIETSLAPEMRVGKVPDVQVRQ
jgi:IclR family transcriptional regulator, mhp operon transcriptional activator